MGEIDVHCRFEDREIRPGWIRSGASKELEVGFAVPRLHYSLCFIVLYYVQTKYSML